MPYSEPFSAWVGPRDAKIVFVGEAWGREEDLQKEPFVGSSGKEFWLMLGESAQGVHDQHSWAHMKAAQLHIYGNAWIRERAKWMELTRIAFTNVLNVRPPDNKLVELCASKKEIEQESPSYDWPALSLGKYLRPQFLSQVERLHTELVLCRPNLVVALGNTACWALLRTASIGKIRGAITAGDIRGRHQKILPTYHPANVLYQWSQRPIVVADLMKAWREGQRPEIQRPRREILFSPTLDEFRDFVADCLAHPPPLLSCDTETSLGLIDTISFAPRKDFALCIQLGPHRYRSGNNYITTYPVRDGFDVPSYFTPEEELEFWDMTQELLGSPRIRLLFQNGMYDIQYLLRHGIYPANLAEDQMLLHHSIYPEMLKGLGFQGSIYTDEPSWKLMHSRKNDTEKRDE